MEACDLRTNTCFDRAQRMAPPCRYCGLDRQIEPRDAENPALPTRHARHDMRYTTCDAGVGAACSPSTSSRGAVPGIWVSRIDQKPEMFALATNPRRNSRR